MNTTAKLLQISGEELKNRKSAYESGERTVYSVFNEVVETNYSRLAGIITDLIRYEESKKVLDKDLMHYYDSICSALWLEKSYYNQFTDKEIVNISNLMSPLIKELTPYDEPEQQKIIENNKDYFESLLSRWSLS